MQRQEGYYWVKIIRHGQDPSEWVPLKYYGNGVWANGKTDDGLYAIDERIIPNRIPHKGEDSKGKDRPQEHAGWKPQ